MQKKKCVSERANWLEFLRSRHKTQSPSDRDFVLWGKPISGVFTVPFISIPSPLSLQLREVIIFVRFREANSQNFLLGGKGGSLRLAATTASPECNRCGQHVFQSVQKYSPPNPSTITSSMQELHKIYWHRWEAWSFGSSSYLLYLGWQWL